MEIDYCCVCLDEIEQNNSTPCTTCKKYIHDACILQVINETTSYNVCPHCRSNLPEKFLPEIIKRQLRDIELFGYQDTSFVNNIRMSLIHEELHDVFTEPEEISQPISNNPNLINVNNLYWI